MPTYQLGNSPYKEVIIFINGILENGNIDSIMKQGPVVVYVFIPYLNANDSPLSHA